MLDTPPDELTPEELAAFRAAAKKLQANYSRRRTRWFLKQGREYHANPKPGRPR